MLQGGQIANAFFKLPGDYLRPEDAEIDGFKARLDERLAPVGRLEARARRPADLGGRRLPRPVVAPQLRDLHVPFIPAHITRPKECKEALLYPAAEVE